MVYSCCPLACSIATPQKQRLKFAHKAGFMATVFAVVVVGNSLYAQLPVAELTSISPPGGQVGSEFGVQANGSNHELGKLLFSHSGISAKPRTASRNEFLPELQPIQGQFDVTVAKDVPPGIYDVRLSGRFGVSNPRAFMVGQIPEVKDNSNNRNTSSAQVITLPVTISGIVEANATDYYKIRLTAGQRILIDCWAERIDSRMDGSLAIFGAQGKELKRSLNSNGHDPLIDFTPQIDGEYIIALWDFVFDGGADYFYRLSIHQKPHVDFVFPPAGLAGTKMPATVFGRNLPGSFSSGRMNVDGTIVDAKLVNIQLPIETDTLAVGGFLRPESVLLDGFHYGVDGNAGAFIGLSHVPVVVEQEPNNDPDAAQVVPVPAEVAGQFYPVRDADSFEFSMKKGETFIIDVLSQRLGLDTDPIMQIEKIVRDPSGKSTTSVVAQVDDPQNRNNLVGSPFDTSTDDPSYKLTADADSTYRVTVRDQFGAVGSDPRYVYRLAIRPQQPDFRLHAVPQELQVANANEVKLTSLAVRRGGTTTLKIVVERLEGFSSQVSLVVEGLPKGVECKNVLLEPGQDTAWLVFVAAEDTEQWAGSIKIVGTSEIAGKKLRHEARCGAITWGTANKTLVRPEFRLARELYLAVIPEITPAHVKAVADGVLETSLGGKIDVPLEIARRSGLTGPVKLVATNIPNEIKPADVDIAADKSSGTLSIAVTNAKARPGLYHFYLRSDAKLKYSRNPEAVTQAENDLKKLGEAIAQLTSLVAERKSALETLKQQASAAAADKMAAEQAFKDAEAKLKRANDLKTAEEKRLADVKKASQPADVSVALISTPIHLRIEKTPLKLITPDAKVSLPKNAKTEFEVTLQRKYGCADAVELTVELPKEASGVNANKASIGGDQKSAKLTLNAAADAKAGVYAATVRAKAKFNGIDVEDTLPITVTVP